ncbi:hypothetical protein BGW36DRAFT_361150 [Talaromyces proteolyticus]|uniref:Protein kinase domain-containing protein n=1 Tax=Talaromyces proteolyticus TaxID=1131652 RepID=A0AAD4KNI6_9EURO|nr:uncharacterized protein BGW36DRAFT_361150 [Talaromyces proteolyticus]KAH8695454.1 hypothetical protein BGW36DRAFT_361150 [Talaromyces proteolyticus]
MDIAVSVLSIADICIKYGTILVKVCKSYRSGDQEIREIILKIEAHWLRIQRQLEFLRKIWASLDEDYQIHLNTVLQVLQVKAMAATSLVDGLIGQAEDEVSSRSIIAKKGNTKRARYAILVKEKLNDALNDLKDWKDLFDPSWILIIRQSDQAIDHELNPVDGSESTSLLTLKELRKAIKSTITTQADAESTTVFVESNSFEQDSIDLEYSSLVVWRDVQGLSTYVADPPNDTTSLASICKLAKILKNVEPAQFGILQCHGVSRRDLHIVSEKESSLTRFIFSIPDHLTKPQSLRKLVLSEIGNRPLDERFILARQLAKAVMFVHSAGFVHKNIRPETILVLRDQHQDPNAFLTGFKSFRLEEGRTLLRGDDFWEFNLYRHPTRQGMHPEESYSMQHDIYSLGVCLLEIGIAGSLVLYETEKVAKPSPIIAALFSYHTKDTRKNAFELKRALVKLAEDLLPSKMGRKYTETVVTCLTCLDKSDNAFGLESEFLDENGLLVGVRFIEKVSTA